MAASDLFGDGVASCIHEPIEGRNTGAGANRRLPGHVDTVQESARLHICDSATPADICLLPLLLPFIDCVAGYTLYRQASQLSSDQHVA